MVGVETVATVAEGKPKTMSPEEVKQQISKGILYLREITIEGSLDLEGATIEGSLDLSFRHGPKKIYVYPEIAELVHFTAPTTPLVLVKRRR